MQKQLLKNPAFHHSQEEFGDSTLLRFLWHYGTPRRDGSRGPAVQLAVTLSVPVVSNIYEGIAVRLASRYQS